MNYTNDQRIVATLDAGGTNFVFSAIQGNKELIEPIRFSSNADDLEKCIATLKQGFSEVFEQLPSKPVAISFAFPGPADYALGIIGDLPNFPAFRGGVPLKAILEEAFGIPVYINNDGSLFAYGEALAGVLPELNKDLTEAGVSKQYKHLYGVTFGTGFGGGAVINNELLIGDNSCGGDIYCFRNKLYADDIAEESVGVNAIKRVYREVSGDDTALEPKDIYDIADGAKDGNKAAAQQAFAELGEVAGDALAHALTTIDGIVAIGGGLAGAAKYIFPTLVKEMNSNFKRLSGDVLSRMQVKVYNLADAEEKKAFLKNDEVDIPVPGTTKTVKYNPERKIAVMASTLGASQAIALGAYAFALKNIDQ